MNMDAKDLVRMNCVMRHTLRNFASGIKTAMSILSTEADGVLPPNCMEYFPLIINECNRLDVITRRWNLLFDPVPRGEPESADYVLNRLLAEVHDDFPMSHVSVKTDGNETAALVPDAEALRIALREVLDNAVEACGKNEVLITCGIDTSMLKFLVHDHGSGVSDENCEAIFNPFHTTKSSHLGIGLTIARRFVNGLGGSISACRNGHCGLAVELVIPVVIPEGR